MYSWKNFSNFSAPLEPFKLGILLIVSLIESLRSFITSLFMKPPNSSSSIIFHIVSAARISPSSSAYLFFKLSKYLTSCVATLFMSTKSLHKVLIGILTHSINEVLNWANNWQKGLSPN
uniref:Uncharacterized protein n=1 Tax=Glossina palpalis gambiensis TaxID=67801 RepID=A0A1B0C324_9MUSC